MKKTLYQALGVDSSATSAEIAEGYARCTAANEAGPYDRNVQVIAREAFRILSHPDRRAMYDLSLTASQTITAPPAEPKRSMKLPVIIGALVVMASIGMSVWWGNRTEPVPPVQLPRPPVIAATVAAPMPEQDVQADDDVETAVAAPIASDLSAEELFAKLAPAIVRINVSGNKGRVTGSGVVIAPRTVITNCHVAQAGSYMEVKHDATTYFAKLTLADEAHDLCKLDVPSLPAEPVSIRTSDALRTGQKVVAIGAPKGLDLTISEGIVSSLREVDDGTLIQTTAPVSPGSSGGGLFDMRGNLIGIVTFQMAAGQNLNFASPAEWIGKMSATKGNGIIAKLAGGAHVPNGESKAREELRANMPGLWSCRDTIHNKAYIVEANPDGDVEIRLSRDKIVAQGRWYVHDYKVIIRMFDSPRIWVDHVDAVKLVLNTHTGLRLVCSRD